jgi:L-lysine 2,3-aminomutase
MAVPQLVVDLPDGGGKVAVQRSPIVRQEGEALVMKNREGVEYLWVDAAGAPLA